MSGRRAAAPCGLAAGARLRLAARRALPVRPVASALVPDRLGHRGPDSAGQSAGRRVDPDEQGLLPSLQPRAGAAAADGDPGRARRQGTLPAARRRVARGGAGALGRARRQAGRRRRRPGRPAGRQPGRGAGRGRERDRPDRDADRAARLCGRDLPRRAQHDPRDHLPRGRGAPFIAAAAHRFGTSATAPVDSFKAGGLSALVELDTGCLSVADPGRGQRPGAQHEPRPGPPPAAVRRAPAGHLRPSAVLSGAALPAA